MKPSRALSFVLGMGAALGLHAATTTTVVDIPAAEGGMQRFLYVRPDAPTAFIVQYPGGDGVLGIASDGAMNAATGLCNPYGRTQAAFAGRGIGLALIDATTLGGVRNYDNLLAIVRYVRERHNVPVWVSGGSSSTSATAFAAATLPAEIPAGVLFYSPDRPNPSVPMIRRPAGVVYHPSDVLQFSSLMFNALTSAAVRDRVSVTGGADVGCGFHLFNGAEAAFVDAVAGIVARNNHLTAAVAALNVHGLWWRSPAESESGWGVNLTQQGEILFATWFTYDADGRGMWLVMPTSTRSGNTWTGALYRTTGPAFSATPFNPNQVAATPMGMATFAFTDANSGTFSYVVGAVSQAKSITRQVYGALPVCEAGGAAGSPPNYQALWWSDPPGGESGWGVNVTHQGDILFATWFTYDADGRGMWLVMPNGARTGPGAYSGTLYRTTGPAFSANPWVGTGVAATPMGTGAFNFADANRGTFSYSVGGVTQSKPILRQEISTPPTVCR
jgi:hypothetical protein